LRALREGLPLGHADFYVANQAEINAQATVAFDEARVVDSAPAGELGCVVASGTR